MLKDFLSEFGDTIVWFIAVCVIIPVIKIIVSKKGEKKNKQIFENSKNQNNVFVAVKPDEKKEEKPAEETEENTTQE